MMILKKIVLVANVLALCACGGGGGGGGGEPAPSLAPVTTTNTASGTNSSIPVTGSTSSGPTNTSDSNNNTSNNTTVNTATTSTDQTGNTPAAEEVSPTIPVRTESLVVDPEFDFRPDREIEILVTRPTDTEGAVHIYKSRDENADANILTIDPFSRITTLLAGSDTLAVDVGGAWPELILHFVPEDGATPDSLVSLAINNPETIYTVQF